MIILYSTYALLILISQKLAFATDNKEFDFFNQVVELEDDDPKYILKDSKYKDLASRQGKFFRWDYGKMNNPVMNVLVQAHPIKEAAAATNDPLDIFKDSYPLPEGLTEPLPEYDFIVVGAGSAGSVLASRLSEDKKINVLLLEAGKPESLITEIPIIVPMLQDTIYTWQYYMEKQEGVCAGMEKQRCFWPRGRAVGGTSVINYMIYTRGRPEDWDRIAADGNYGWSYKEVLPYFLKSERAFLKKNRHSPYHNTTGDLSVQNLSWRTKLASSFLRAAEELGHKVVDYNSPDGFGFDHVQSTINAGRRYSVAKAFLHSHKKRKNLHILPEATVTKVLIDPHTKTAYGVNYVKNFKKYTVRARREVILSAGPIASPQLLMLSGVGPAEHLREIGIHVIQESKVGETLYDHIAFPGAIFLLNKTGISMVLERVATLENAIRWLQYGDGPISSTGYVEGIGYIKTNVSTEIIETPDIELIMLSGSFLSDGGTAFRKSLKITDQFYNSVYGRVNNHESFTIVPMLLHPKSKGHMKLKDKDPFSHPKLYGNYLTDEKDIKTLIAAIRHIIKLGETNAFQTYGAKLHEEPYPTCLHYEYNSDLYWECAIRTLTATLHHQLGTCKMGPAWDADAVVDPELRVYGIHRLRVADTSIIPRTTCAHTNAPGVMIGEKAAELLKNSW